MVESWLLKQEGKGPREEDDFRGRSKGAQSVWFERSDFDYRQIGRFFGEAFYGAK